MYRMSFKFFGVVTKGTFLFKIRKFLSCCYCTVVPSTNMEKKFTDKRALVTGAGRGIGKALVLELVKQGAHVTALSLTKRNLQKLKEEVPEIETVSVDVKNWKETEDAVKKLGPIDLLVNNAGVISLQAVGSITEEEVDKCLAVNVKAVINISQIVAKGMVERKTGGAIVNISSQAAIIGLPNHASYCASKGAVDQVTKVLAIELGPHKIRVNSVNPTVVLTDMGATAIKSYGEGKEVEDALKAKIPLGKFCEVKDVVKATLFLLSDEDAGMITGSQLPLDGGYIIQ